MALLSSKGSTRAWRRQRRLALVRDNGQCQQCLLDGRYVPATEVDHIKPRHKGGDDSLRNLRSLCSGCHKHKTLNDVGANPNKSGPCDAAGKPSDPSHHWNQG